jgi:UDP-N-acetylglucosamine 2-epimerase (non-hydrolysing)
MFCGLSEKKGMNIKLKILSIIGARPQFIKEAIIQNEIVRHKNIKEIIVHTGQHYDENMSGVFFDVLNMRKPDYNLGINGSKHGEMTGTMIIELEKIMLNEKPDIVLLYGDTNSTLAGAIAAAKLKIKIAHVEAGLRRKIMKNTPEETNRVITDRISDYLFAPSKLSVDNLKKEGKGENVYLTGDVMYDIYLKMKRNFDESIVEKLKLKKDKYIVMTLHRDFNVDIPEKLEMILKGVNKVSQEMPVVLPIHPRTQKRIEEFGLKEFTKYIKIIEPIDYLKLMALTENCYKIITDSGGYQKEAYFAKKQAIVIMPETNWRELSDVGYNILSQEDQIYNNTLQDIKIKFEEGIYGDGTASKKIINIILSSFDQNEK